MPRRVSKSGARKSAFLGMPHGTAGNRLRKLILFDLLRRHGENVCLKCSKEIETADELSIEHKQPWCNDCYERRRRQSHDSPESE
jgi:hypothetical protein